MTNQIVVIRGTKVLTSQRVTTRHLLGLFSKKPNYNYTQKVVKLGNVKIILGVFVVDLFLGILVILVVGNCKS